MTQEIKYLIEASEARPGAPFLRDHDLNSLRLLGAGCYASVYEISEDLVLKQYLFEQSIFRSISYLVECKNNRQMHMPHVHEFYYTDIAMYVVSKRLSSIDPIEYASLLNSVLSPLERLLLGVLSTKGVECVCDRTNADTILNLAPILKRCCRKFRE